MFGFRAFVLVSSTALFLLLQDLRDAFYSFGELRSIRIVPGKDFAFVQFTTRQAAEAAAEQLYKVCGSAKIERRKLHMQEGARKVGRSSAFLASMRTYVSLAASVDLSCVSVVKVPRGTAREVETDDDEFQRGHGGDVSSSSFVSSLSSPLPTHRTPF